jgi:hypothetical protein
MQQNFAGSNPDDLIRDLNAARERLDERTEQLEIIADWRDDLTIRIRRARLAFELVGLDVAEQDRLIAEVEEFRRTCRCLAWRHERGRQAA